MIETNCSMNPPRRILLATDLSARCDRALDRAAQLASQWEAQLVIMHVIEAAPLGATHREFEETPSWRRAPDPSFAVEQQIRRDLRNEVTGVSIILEEGPIAQSILDVVAREECDLAILGSARDGSFGGSSGNTIEQVVRRCPASVLVVKTRPRGPYRHLLVGTDFTPESRHGLRVAATLFPDATYMLMHAFEMPYRSLLEPSQLSRDFAAMEEATIKGFVDEAGLSPEVRNRVSTSIEHGPPGAMMSAYVTERDADLTVIGALGRGLLFHVLIGGTARRIVDAVPSDILVVRATS